jgi:hypothetical protein
MNEFPIITFGLTGTQLFGILMGLGLPLIGLYCWVMSRLERRRGSRP